MKTIVIVVEVMKDDTNKIVNLTAAGAASDKLRQVTRDALEASEEFQQAVEAE